MGTRSFAQVAPTARSVQEHLCPTLLLPMADTLSALDAFIFGYAGHSLVTPHTALKQLWWTNDRIDKKVTRRFVLSELKGQERELLDRPLAFGEGLTDDTYMEWILERAKRLFLILAEVGVPDRIFSAIDDSWQDDDLPLSRHDIEKLEISLDHSDRVNQKFYDLQFVYLLRTLRRGCHIDYGPKEHIPMEWTFKLPPAASIQHWDRVHFPLETNKTYVRRKFEIRTRDNHRQLRLDFLKDVETANGLTHEHIAPVWASYTSEDSGFILSDFVAEHTLRTFMNHRTPPQFSRLCVSDRYILLFEWMHCLADTIASLHHRKTYHGAIRPSDILIDCDNRIAFADVGHIRSFQANKKFAANEKFEYSAPESGVPRANKVRVLRATINDDGNPRRGSDTTPPSPPRSSESSICPSPRSAKFGSFSSSSSKSPPISFRNFGRNIPFPIRTGSLPSMSRRSSLDTSLPSAIDTSPTSVLPSPPMTPTAFANKTDSIDFASPFNTRSAPPLRSLPTQTPQAADVFSLGAVYLDILTFLLKGKITDFLKYRQPSKRRPSSSPTDTPLNSTNEAFFHADSSRIDIWMDGLRADVFKHDDPLVRVVPELLTLVRAMLSQNPEARPSAQSVKLKIEDVLIRECGVENLCCQGRIWGGLPEEGKISKGLRNSICVASAMGPWTPVRGSNEDHGSVITRTESRSDTRSVSVNSYTGLKGLRLLWKGRGPSLKVP